MILDFLFRSKKGGVYIDVWANHPSRLSNTFFFYKFRWWTGVNIEPNPSLHKKFIFSRNKDINLNVWISSDAWKLNFYEFSPDTLSTFSNESSQDYIKQWHTLSAEYEIPVIPLSEIFSKYSQKYGKIDFLSVDTEWYDMTVLRSNDWIKYRPSAIVLETLEYKKDGGWVKLMEEFWPFLKEKWYMVYADTYINTIFISDEFAREISFQ